MNDMHTHILPAIDDGSKNSKMSVDMIKALAAEGVEKIVLTPHFYPSENSVEQFLKRRAVSLEHLKRAAEGESLGAEIYIGAEVFYMDSLDKAEGFERLAIDGTSYMLLEMPFDTWSDRTLETVYRIISCGITPIIVHFERFIPFQKDMSGFYELRNMGCILQMNAAYFTGFFNRRRAFKFFGEGLCKLIGSDCHNLDSRPPKLKFAYDAIRSRFGEAMANDIDVCGNSILKTAVKAI